MKRIKKTLLLSVLMGTMLTGCGNQAQPTETKQEAVDVQVNTDEIELETREFGGISVQIPAESKFTDNKYYDYTISSNPEDKAWVRVCDAGIVEDCSGVDESNVEDFVEGIRRGMMNSSTADIKMIEKSHELSDTYIFVYFKFDLTINHDTNHSVIYYIINRSNSYCVWMAYYALDESLPYYDFFQEKMVDTFTIASADSNEQELSDIDPALKEFLDSYEAFIDEYIEFMTKYKQNPNDASLLSEYTNIMGRYTEFAKEINEWQGKQTEMSEADWNYYIEVTTRCNQKMSSVAIGYSQ